MKKRLQPWGDARVVPIASVFVFNQSNKLLLLKRHSENLGGGKWGTPGGRLEEGEDAETAALRELREETGLDTPDILLLGAHEIKMPHGKVHMTSFKMVAPNEVNVLINPEEHHAYEWFNLESLLGESGLLWGVPTVLRDFGLMEHFETDPTLADGSEIRLLNLGG